MTKRTTRSRKKQPASGQPLPGWIWLLTGLIIGLSATFLPRLNEEKNALPTESTAEIRQAEPAPNRKFDFYTLLPELEVVVDDNEVPPSENRVASNDTGSYILQVGSFKSLAEADSLKAQLALMGVETNIETVTVNANKWHRVRIGPDRNKSQLLSIQKRLREAKMDSVLLRARS